MKPLASLAVAIGLIGGTIVVAQNSQQQPPAPIERATPPDQPENLLPAPPPRSSNPHSSNLRVDTQLVLLNVSVADRHGNPIRNLKPSDFHIVEDDSPQSVMIAEEHKTEDPSSRVTLPPLPPGDYTNFPLAPPTASLNILLLDAMNTGLRPQMFAYQNVIKFVRTQLPPGARVAIFRLDPGGLSIIQGFTDDPARLEAALKNPRAWPKPRIYLGQTGVRAVGALHELDTFLQFFPGRKNLIWFAGSFPGRGVMGEDNALADALLERPSAGGQHVVANDVAIFPVNPRGLEAPSLFNAENSSVSLRNTELFSHDFVRGIDNQEMDRVADETGGKAFYNNNGLDQQIAESIRIGSNYYTLTYHPQPLRRGYHHRIHITVDVPDAKLFYRSDYIARKPKQTASGILIARAVQFGAPETTDIIFRAHVAPSAKQPDQTDPPVGDTPANVKDKSIRYQLDLAAMPRGITYQRSPDGTRHASLLLTAIAYDEYGERLNSISQQPNVTITPQQYEAALKQGYGFSLQLDLPEHTQAVRLVMADATGRTGSLEVPIDMKDERHKLLATMKPPPKP